MKPTVKQIKRRLRSFKFEYGGRESWFYIGDVLERETCSFHQPGYMYQQDVFGLPVKTLLNALEKCGYITKKRERK